MGWKLRLAFISVCMSFTYIKAETIIPGGDVDGIWDATGSPYIVGGDITVPLNETLIIDPGVAVLFQGAYEFVVNGWLEAIGTSTDSILITAQDTSNRWEGFSFNESQDTSRLEYCIIEYGYSDNHSGGVDINLFAKVVISHCTLRYNLGERGAAIYAAAGSVPEITYNDIIYNGGETITDEGGGISIAGDGLVAYNNINYNFATNWAGGLYIADGYPRLIGNYFVGNRSDGQFGFGAALFTEFQWSVFEMTGNVFANNTASQYGGAIFSDYLMMDKAIVYNNSAERGGGFFSYNLSPAIRASNSIIWRNSLDQISGRHVTLQYCDVQGGWPGLGGLDEDPLFIAPDYLDFRLQWGSPCIDTGDPDPTKNDPDGTCCDIGPNYYDQSVPVRAIMTPHERSIVIPSEGGAFDYTLWVTCIDPTQPMTEIYANVTLPDGSIYGPVLGPVTTSLDSGVTISRERVQAVPANAPGGIYQYTCYAVAGSDTSHDSFSFYKVGPAQAIGTLDWNCSGESLMEQSQTVSDKQDYALINAHPNPFNQTAAFSYELRVVSYVILSIYDVAGRRVTTLVDGHRDVGMHEVMFDGSGLASGVYLYRLEVSDSGNPTYDTGKMVLLK